MISKVVHSVVWIDSLDLAWYRWYDEDGNLTGMNYFHGEYEPGMQMAPDDLLMIMYDNMKRYLGQGGKRVTSSFIFERTYEIHMMTFDNRK